ncbi:MAG: hypothetical protein WDO71_06370 [Bacteroidota bacterium]
MQQLITSIFNYTAGSVSVLFGLVYLFRVRFLPYHEDALNKDWKDVTPAFQVLILALMRAVGGGAAASGFSIIILQYYHHTNSGSHWIPVVILINGLLISCGSLYAMLLVRLKTSGRPPIWAIAVSVLLLFAGYFTSMR